jgi:C1A family cysteine protease
MAPVARIRMLNLRKAVAGAASGAPPSSDTAVTTVAPTPSIFLANAEEAKKEEMEMSVGAGADVDLRSKFGAVYDQGSIGSCTANAICGAYRLLDPDDSFWPSRLYVYTKERMMMDPGKPITDSGSYAALGLSWIQNTGVCPESDWPYDITKVNVVPPSSCDVSAAGHKLGGTHDLTVGVTTMNGVIANMQASLESGLPVLLAIAVYDSFMSNVVAATGVVPVPRKNSEQLLGGHEVTVLGFQSAQNRFIVANSWGTNWGVDGFFYLPYDYIRDPNLAFDFLTFSKVVRPPPPPPPPSPPPPPQPKPPQPKPPAPPKPKPKPPAPPKPKPKPPPPTPPRRRQRRPT